MGKEPVVLEELEAEENFDDESDILFDDEKYLKGRRDSKNSKTKYARRPRARTNSSGNSEMENLAKQQLVEEFHVTEVKSRKLSSTPSDEVDIDAELASLVKDMQIKPKESDGGAELSKNVYYYGWFLGPTASESLTKLSEASLAECLEVAQFSRWIDTTGNHGIEFSKGARDVTSYYQNARKSLLHITAKFCGRVECVPYATEANPHVGSEFTLAIVGFYFTEKTFGLRVKLTDDQWRLFDNERGRCLARRNSVPLTSNDTSGQEGKNGKSVASGGVEKKRSKNYPGLSFVTQRENFQPTDSRAHITIGTGPKVKAKQTGEDLLDIIDMELRSTTLFHDYKVPSGTLRQFGRHGDYVFVLYPKSRVYVKGVFLPFA